MNQAEFEKYVDQYLQGQLQREEVEILWEEVVKDPERLEYLKNVANAMEASRELRHEEKNKYRRSAPRTSYIKYAAAAAIALVIGVLAVVRWTGTSEPHVEPIATIELNYYRSASGDAEADPSKINDIVDRAIRLANRGEINKAISILKKRREEMDDPVSSARISLNLGSLQYNAGRYDQAIANFRRVIEEKQHVDVLTLEKAYWFLGNAYFQQGDMMQARNAIRNAYELNGAYRRVAGRYLNVMANR